MKKMLAFILGIVMLVCLFAPAMAEEAELIYIFGGASDPNRAKLKKMGQQSWYPMYSTQINAGENIDLSTFKECMLTETGMWKPAEEAVIKSYEPGHEDEDMVCTGPWFTIRKDGYQVGDNGFSSAVKWVCEVDGVYDVFINYSGGTSEGGPDEPYYDLVGGYYVPATDGVYMSMFIKDELMFCVDTYEAEGHIIPQTTMEFNGVEMKAGDSIWLVSDTKANGGWDSPWYYLVIRLVSK